MDESAVIAGYDRLLTSVGDRADDIAARPVVTHWPHVGSAYRGLVVVGQAVYGWADDYQAKHFRTEAGRSEAIAAFRARVDKPDPLHWIDTHPVRNSPFWRAVRLIVEGLEPDLDAPWYARFAWVNLYPAAPEDPPGNPGGPLKEAQDPHVGPLLRAVTDMLDAKRVIAVVGPFWWLAAGPADLEDLPERPRPLYRGGRAHDRTWVVGWHPTALATAALTPSPTPRSSSTRLPRSKRTRNLAAIRASQVRRRSTATPRLGGVKSAHPGAVAQALGAAACDTVDATDEPSRPRQH